MGWFTPANGLSNEATEVLQQLADSGSSESAAVAECLNTIAENGGDQNTDDHLAWCAIEIVEAALAVFEKLAGERKLYNSTVKTLRDVANSYGEKYRYAELGWTLEDVKTYFDVDDARAEKFFYDHQSDIRDRLCEAGNEIIRSLGEHDELPPIDDDKTMADWMTAATINFFDVEIANEEKGGVKPATLGSAMDSLMQAPDDVVREWCNDDTVNGEDEVIYFRDHISRMQVIFRSDKELQELLREHKDENG